MPDGRSRFVLICQQLLACGVVLAFAAPAAGVVTLDIVAPRPDVAPAVASSPRASAATASAADRAAGR